MSDKITYEDLEELKRLQGVYVGTSLRTLQKALGAAIEVAQADAPRLPEGWVLETTAIGNQRVLWHRSGRLAYWKGGVTRYAVSERLDLGSSIEPFPTVASITAEQVEKIAEGTWKSWTRKGGLSRWDVTSVTDGLRNAGFEVGS